MQEDQKAQPMREPTGRSRMIFLVIGLAVLVIGLTYIALLAQTRQQQPSQVTPTVTVTPSPVDETANWKAFISEDKKFSFKYPYGWEYYDLKNWPGIEVKGKKYSAKQIEFGEPLSIEQRNQQGYLDPKNAPRTLRQMVLIYSTSPDFNNLKLEEIHSDLSIEFAKELGVHESTLPVWEDIVVGGNIPAKKVNYSCQAGCTSVFFKNGNTIYEFYITDTYPEVFDKLDQILSTFRFTR